MPEHTGAGECIEAREGLTHARPDFTPVAGGVTITVTEDVAQALAAAALGAQGTALHYAGYYSTLADKGRYSDTDREGLRERASHQVEIAEHLHEAAGRLNEALGTRPVVELGAAS